MCIGTLRFGHEGNDMTHNELDSNLREEFVRDVSDIQHSTVEPRYKNLIVSFAVVIIAMLMVLTVISISQGAILNRRSPVLSHLSCREKLVDASDKALGEVVNSFVQKKGDVAVAEANTRYQKALSDLERSRDSGDKLFCDELPS